MKNKDLGKRVKELRKRKGISQELLAENSGLSLRTIQRIENSETQPTGDSIKRLANGLEVTPNELIDWQIKEDNSVILLMNLSQLGFIAFPLLGILIPLIIWIAKKDLIKDANQVGKSILNFQLTWTLILFLIAITTFIISKLQLSIQVSFSNILIIIAMMYFFNFILIIFNTLRYHNGRSIQYKPSISFLK